MRRFSHNHSGARVLFSGEVRASSHGRAVRRLEYTAHRALAEKQMHDVLTDAAGRFPISSAVCIHRVGLLLVQEPAVVVVTCGGHRAETYEANRYIIDRVKAEAPIWKREFFEDGTSAWGENCGAKH